MTKKELVDRLAESFDLTKKAAEGVIIAVIEGIYEGTARDGISRSPTLSCGCFLITDAKLRIYS